MKNVWKELNYFKVKKSGHMVGQLRPVELVVKGFEKEKGNLSLLAAEREKLSCRLFIADALIMTRKSDYED